MIRKEEQELDALLEQCRGRDPDVRLAAILELERLDARRALAPLMPLVEDEDESIREAAIHALGSLGHDHRDQVGPVLETLLIDPDRSIRNQAAEALGLLGYGPARLALERTLRDDDWVVRASAAWALGEIGDTRTLDTLWHALTDVVGPVRAYAALSVGVLGIPSSLPAIHARLAVEPESSVRAELLVAALRLGDETAFADILALVARADKTVAIGVVNTLDDLVRRKTPAIVSARAEEFCERLRELSGRWPVLESQISRLLARLETHL